MGLFNNQERMNRLQAVKATPSQPVQEIQMIVVYFDGSLESINITFNLEELVKLVSSSFETGTSMNFTSVSSPFSINPRWVKKIIYHTK